MVSRFEVVLGFGGGAAMTTQAIAGVPYANDSACNDRTINLMVAGYSIQNKLVEVLPDASRIECMHNHCFS